MSRTRTLLLASLATSAIGAVVVAPAGAVEWLDDGAAPETTEPVTYSGGEFKLEAGAKSITCKTVTGTGEVSPGTMGNAKTIHFSSCTAGGAPNCDPHSPGAANGLILVSNALTELTEKENSSKEKVLADEFKANATTKEFTTLEFTALTVGACSSYPTTKVKGAVSAEVDNPTEELDFPSPELEGNTLEAFGKAAKLVGSVKQELVNGEELQAENNDEKVWRVENKKLYLEPEGQNLRTWEKGTGGLSAFKLSKGGAGAKFKIACANGANFTIESGKIILKKEIDGSLIFEKCSVTEPAHCEVGEWVEGVFLSEQIAFRNLEGKLSGENVNFIANKAGAPIAQFEIYDEGANNCTVKDEYSLTGTFRAYLRQPDRATVEKRFLFSDARLLEIENSKKEKSPGELIGEIATKLDEAPTWNIGPA